MADFRDRSAEFVGAGFGIAAVSVDQPKRSAALVEQLNLPFPLLCDTRRELARSWRLLNEKEKGGIAKPAVFVLDRNRRVLYCSVDQTYRRIGASELLAFLNRGAAAQAAPRKRWIVAGLREWFRALANLLRYGAESPKQ